jgi:hypothetical protein
MTASNPTAANHNSTTTPGSGAALASLAVAPGRYLVAAYAYYGGTVSTVTEADNIGLYIDGSLLTALSLVGVAATGPANPFRFTVVTTTGAIALKAIGAGTASSVYKTLLTAQLVNLSEYL